MTATVRAVTRKKMIPQRAPLVLVGLFALVTG